MLTTCNKSDILMLYELDRKDILKKGTKKLDGKTKRFTIRLTDKEHEMFIKKSTERNMKISEYLIFLVENDK